MIILADEGIEREIVVQLRSAGHEVFYIAEYSAGITDDAVLCEAARLGAVLLTADKDFGELIFRKKLKNFGVMLTRLYGLSNQEKASVVLAAFANHGAVIRNNFCVLLPTAMRIRSIPD